MLDILKRAIDRNIICYDSDAQQGVISNKLIELLKTEAIRNSYCNECGAYKQFSDALQYLIIPVGVKVKEEISGLQVIIDPTLSVENFKLLTGHLPKDKVNIIIGYAENLETDEVNVIMGAF